jgi:hypothetical protein
MGSDDRPLGDTDQAHDEISPRDLPPGHPGRREAERRAGDDGTTTGPVGPGEEHGARTED